MSTRHQEILLGVSAQAFFFDVPDGRPDADPVPTVAVYDATLDDGAATEAATTGAVEIDSVDAELAEAAIAGTNTVEVDDATDIERNRRYLLGGELVEVLGIAGTTLTLRRPLLNDFDAGVSFQGTRLSIDVADAWAADDNNLTDDTEFAGYRLRWSYSVNGEARVSLALADVVRYSSQNLVTALDVDDRFPGFIDRLGPDNRENQGAAIIREAFDAVRYDALGDAKILRRMRDTQVLADLVKHKANVIAIENQVIRGAANMLDALKVARDAYEVRYRQLIREPKVPFDPSGEGASAEAERLPVMRR